MRLKVIGSGSSGNGYLLQSASGQTLLIECGCHIDKIKKALDFKVNNVSAIVSHSHGDHSKCISNVLLAGIPVYASKHTFEAKGIKEMHLVNVIEAGISYRIGEFKIKPFDVEHDVPTLGFLIHHPEMGLVVFLTDTCYSDYVFPGANNYILECNHDQDIMSNNGTAKFLRDRIIKSHMNIETCKELLKANDMTQVNNIVLIHLSNNNSNATQFLKEITQLTGKNVFIADAGLNIEFNKTPF